jgi:hypothetical protein
MLFILLNIYAVAGGVTLYHLERDELKSPWWTAQWWGMFYVILLWPLALAHNHISNRGKNEF